MENSAIIQKVLRILAGCYSRSCSLEELASLADPALKRSLPAHDLITTEKQKQALLLETLLQLNDQGLIFLDSKTDRSVITIKGLLKVNSKDLCN